MIKIVGGILFVLSLAYPLIIYFLGNQLPASTLIFGLIFVLIIRSALQYKKYGAHHLCMTALIAAILLGLFSLNGQIAIYLYPMLMSLSFACALGWTLLYPPSLIERFARITEPDLDADGVTYTRNVTMIWLGFSCLNATISFATAMLDDGKIWLLYNGLISYVLIGLLMGGEYVFRICYRARKKHQSATCLVHVFIPAHRLLALRNQEFWSRYWDSTEFSCYLGYIGALVAKIRAADAKRVFVISEDRAYFLAGFLAVLYADTPVVLPQSTSPESLRDLMEPGDVLLTDQPHLASVGKTMISMTIDNNTTTPLKFAPLDPERSIVIFYTSGSTGRPKTVEKTLCQLESEVDVLHVLWGRGPQGKFLSTVSHHHLYAFLYSLLWPVCSGFPTERLTFTYWGDLLRKSSVDDFVISSPSHLGRFSILGEYAPQSFRRVFSSGAPLPYEAAVESKKYLGVTIIEVYGSTETGGIAFRQQEKPATPWQRFDCVEVSSGPGNKLRVKSPYIGGGGFYQTEDQVTWEDANSFHLLGRADRIVKVEGKRTSLTEIEDRLCQSDLVADAAILVLEKSYRDELGAVIVLSELGKKTLESCGKIAFIRQLRELLHLYFHPVIIPRKWRFIDAIPINPQGKRLKKTLENYFKKTETFNLGPIRQPIILKKEVSEHNIEYFLRIPHDLAYFEGHFKAMPIVPGVVQVHWVVEFAKADLKLQGAVSLGNQMKFTNLMRPNEEVSLVLSYNPEKASVTYSYRGSECSYSSGKITFTGESPNGL